MYSSNECEYVILQHVVLIYLTDCDYFLHVSRTNPYQASYPRWHAVSSGSAFEREHMLNGKKSA